MSLYIVFNVIIVLIVLKPCYHDVVQQLQKLRHKCGKSKLIFNRSSQTVIFAFE